LNDGIGYERKFRSLGQSVRYAPEIRLWLVFGLAIVGVEEADIAQPIALTSALETNVVRENRA